MKYTIDDAIRKLEITIDPTVSGRVLEACNIALDVLMELKEKEQKTGMWIKSESHTQYFYCSCCKPKGSGDDQWREIFDCRYRYCPNCGARMENGI